ncbi:hypothetical protein P4V46_10720, partial [Brevibacillus borstelensis]|nr:hypothetical protein [Brevibacillus borstelensis]
CLELTVGTANPRSGLSPYSYRPCWAHQKEKLAATHSRKLFVIYVYIDKRTISVMTTMAKTANPRELATSSMRLTLFMSSICDSLHFSIANHLYRYIRMTNGKCFNFYTIL